MLTEIYYLFINEGTLSYEEYGYGSKSESGEEPESSNKSEQESAIG